MEDSCGSVPAECSFQNCENFQIPSSAWMGNCETNIPHEDNCSDNDDLHEVSSEATQFGFDFIPNSYQLYYPDELNDSGCRRRCHHHHRNTICDFGNLHCPKRRDDSSCIKNGGHVYKTKTSSSNESSNLVKRVKSTSCSSLTSLKQNSEDAYSHHGGSHCHCLDRNCRHYVEKTRMVPRVHYIPVVTREAVVSNVPKTAMNTACEESDDECCESCGTQECHCERRCREAIICQRSEDEDKCSSRSSSCENQTPKRKILCW